MNTKRNAVICLLVLIVSLFLAACYDPEEAIKQSETTVAQSVRKEEQLLYEYKNFFVVQGDYANFVVKTQKWVNEHPDKQIIAFAASGDYGTNWVVYYEDRK